MKLHVITMDKTDVQGDLFIFFVSISNIISSYKKCFCHSTERLTYSQRLSNTMPPNTSLYTTFKVFIISVIMSMMHLHTVIINSAAAAAANTPQWKWSVNLVSCILSVDVVYWGEGVTQTGSVHRCGWTGWIKHLQRTKQSNGIMIQSKSPKCDVFTDDLCWWPRVHETANTISRRKFY